MLPPPPPLPPAATAAAFLPCGCPLLSSVHSGASHAPPPPPQPSVPTAPPQEMAFIEQLSPYHYRVNTGFVSGMHVPGVFYVNDRLKGLLFEELQV